MQAPSTNISTLQTLQLELAKYKEIVTRTHAILEHLLAEIKAQQNLEWESFQLKQRGLNSWVTTLSSMLAEMAKDQSTGGASVTIDLSSENESFLPELERRVNKMFLFVMCKPFSLLSLTGSLCLYVYLFYGGVMLFIVAPKRQSSIFSC